VLGRFHGSLFKPPKKLKNEILEPLKGSPVSDFGRLEGLEGFSKRLFMRLRARWRPCARIAKRLMKSLPTLPDVQGTAEKSFRPPFRIVPDWKDEAPSARASQQPASAAGAQRRAEKGAPLNRGVVEIAPKSVRFRFANTLVTY
jgi:hypothetical protein